MTDHDQNSGTGGGAENPPSPPQQPREPVAPQQPPGTQPPNVAPEPPAPEPPAPKPPSPPTTPTPPVPTPAPPTIPQPTAPPTTPTPPTPPTVTGPPSVPPGVPPAPPTQPAGGGGGGGIPKPVLFGVPLLIAAVIAFFLISSGGDDDKAAVEAGGGGGDAKTSLTDAKAATVQIVAEGGIVDPEIGLTEIGGSGSGFIIDSDGIAVTNNHVVTGAASLEVFIPGQDDPVTARVLGASECDDLAVIDLEGGGYTATDWASAPVDQGLEVFSLGYPLGDPELTQTRGIITKTKSSSANQFFATTNSIEHDARINPGNSGGPLVLPDGSVLAVNYAGSDETDQNFALGLPKAKEIVDQLAKGNDINSLGINGQAVFDETLDISGVWVLSVKSGSPADKAGVEGGDIITTLENTTLAEDGTLSDYCKILRSHDAGDTLSIEVLRFDTQEVLKGQVNGDELELSFSFAQEESGNIAEGESYTEFVSVTDDTGKLAVEVPAEWNDISGAETDLGDGLLAPSILASPDIAAFNTYDQPGAQLLLLEDVGDPNAGIEPGLDAGAETFATDCTTSEGRSDYDDGLYVGKFDTYSGCGASGSSFFVLAVTEPGTEFLIIVAVNAVTTADLEALDHVLSTFIAL